MKLLGNKENPIVISLIEGHGIYRVNCLLKNDLVLVMYKDVFDIH